MAQGAARHAAEGLSLQFGRAATGAVAEGARRRAARRAKWMANCTCMLGRLPGLTLAVAARAACRSEPPRAVIGWRGALCATASVAVGAEGSLWLLSAAEGAAASFVRFFRAPRPFALRAALFCGAVQTAAGEARAWSLTRTWRAAHQAVLAGDDSSLRLFCARRVLFVRRRMRDATRSALASSSPPAGSDAAWLALDGGVGGEDIGMCARLQCWPWVSGTRVRGELWPSVRRRPPARPLAAAWSWK